MYVLFLYSEIQPANWVFKLTASIAIWNWKKIVIVISTGIWGVNVIFLIQGKSRPSFRGGTEITAIAAIVRVISWPELQWAFWTHPSLDSRWLGACNG